MPTLPSRPRLQPRRTAPWSRRLLAAGLGMGLALGSPGAQAAENLVFVSGAFRRSIPVDDLVHLAQTGQARGLLGDALQFTHQKPAEIAKLLNQSVTLPVVLISRLLNTRIGEALLGRLSQVMFPLADPGVSIPALRSAIVLGMADSKTGLNAISFLQAYPSQELAISLPALMNLMKKASSISDLVRFFAESPLDGLRSSGGDGKSPQAAPAPANTP